VSLKQVTMRVRQTVKNYISESTLPTHLIQNMFFRPLMLNTSRLTLSAIALGALLVLPQMASADSQSPSIVNGLYTSEGSENSVRVGWNKPWDNVGIDGYNIYRNGSYINTVYETSFKDSGLQAGTPYEYRISAFDSARNYSELSATISFTTAGSAPQPQPDPVTRAASADLSIPTGVRASEVAPGTVKWEWDWVPGAAQYEVWVDGVWSGLTPNTNYFSRDLWVGDHSVSVKSIDAEWRYSSPSETVKIFVGGSSDDGQSGLAASETTAVAPPPPAPAQQPAAQPGDFGPDNGLVDPRSWALPEAQKDGYELVFSDEFNSNGINPARWATNLRWDGEYNGERHEYRVINSEDQFYVNILTNDQEHRNVVLPQANPFEFDGSRLAIRALRNPLQTNKNRNSYGPLRDMVAQQTFLSGALSTHDTFAQKYGYFEARIKIPSHVGTFPAFWLYHKNRKWEGTQRTEIDIMENLGHAPWYIYNTLHYFSNVSATYPGDPNFIRPEPQGQIYSGTDYSQQYHTYAVQWEPGHITWLIDGVKTSEVWHWATNNEALYLILNLAIGGNWTNFPANAGGLGRESWERYPTDNDINNFANPALEIDYVRVYRRR